MTRLTATQQAVHALTATRESMSAEAPTALEQRAQQALAVVNESVELAAEHAAATSGKPDRRPINERRSACRSCGKATAPGDGDQMWAERQRRGVRPDRWSPTPIETYWAPTWKTCQRCLDAAAGPAMWADWLGIDQTSPLGALRQLAEEFPAQSRDIFMLNGGDAAVWQITGAVAAGPIRYDQGRVKAGDRGNPQPWTHPAAARGRKHARARWEEIRADWSDEGVRHPSGAPCGVCGRSHAHMPLDGPLPYGRKDTSVRWSQIKILGGLTVCSTCHKAYSQREGGGHAAGTTADWAAAQAAEAYPVDGLAAELQSDGFVLAHRHPGFNLADGQVRRPWEYLGEARGRLRALSAHPAVPPLRAQPLELDMAEGSV